MSAHRRGPWRQALRLAAERYRADAARCRNCAKDCEAQASGRVGLQRAELLARAAGFWHLTEYLETLARETLDRAERETP